VSSLWVAMAVLFPQSGMSVEAGAPGTPELKEVQRVTSEHLMSVTSVAPSNDGKFLYAAAFNSHVVSAFKRDPETGQLELIQGSQVPELQTAVSVRLSPDNRYASASAFSANAVSLFKRDAETGHLTWLTAARQGEDGNEGLTFAIDANFSADSRFLYTASSTGIGVFQVGDDKLTFVQSQTADGQLKGLRAVVVSPDGGTVYAAGSGSNTIGVLRRDAETGKLEVSQILTDGKDGVESLAGAFRIAVTADGKHIYVSSGRFSGDQAVTVFEKQQDGKLQLLEAHVNGEGDFSGFEGGNSIAISPDEKQVCVVASVSDRLVRFRRDPQSGKLTFIGSQVVGEVAKPGAAGLCFSPDGKFLYVADENSSSIVVYQQP
jgi:6-phosphogluconolactonase (cycloisomerase 2 family)